jgi:hypothetical protein
MNAETHTAYPTWENIKEKHFSGDQVVGRQKPASTRSIAQIFVGVVFNVICMISVANLIACNLKLLRLSIVVFFDRMFVSGE